MDYTALRHFADSWGLLFLCLLFVGIAAWVFRPGASYDEQAQIPFNHDDKRD